MGRLNGLYCEEFPVGTRVRIRNEEFLKEFQRTWNLHHPLSSEQLSFVSRLCVVARVSFYHGADELYELAGVPGLWHEQLLDPAV